ncbi:hypothetical protein ACJQ6Q_004498, partial [Yersinia enterocolitica]
VLPTAVSVPVTKTRVNITILRNLATSTHVFPPNISEIGNIDKSLGDADHRQLALAQCFAELREVFSG